MYIIKRVFKVFLILLIILLIFITLFFGNMIFTLFSSGMLFMDSDDVIYENWHIRLPEDNKEIYYTDSGSSFHGDGERYSIYEYKNEEIVSKAFDWKDKKDNKLEEEIREVIDRLKEQNKNIPKKYEIDFKKKYKYITKIKEDNSKLYLLYIIGENRIYVIEDII